jgi:hypothetical protein
MSSDQDYQSHLASVQSMQAQPSSAAHSSGANGVGLESGMGASLDQSFILGKSGGGIQLGTPSIDSILPEHGGGLGSNPTEMFDGNFLKPFGVGHPGMDMNFSGDVSMGNLSLPTQANNPKIQGAFSHGQGQ